MFRFRDKKMICNSQQYYTFSIWDEEEFFLQAVHTGDVFVSLFDFCPHQCHPLTVFSGHWTTIELDNTCLIQICHMLGIIQYTF